ncbi:MAG: tripartite tricarboxylate transporter permease [Rubrivivax sp.]
MLTTLADPIERRIVELKDSVLPRFREIAQYWRTVLRSGVIGVVTGLLPGVGEDAGAWMSAGRAGGEQGEGEVRQGLDRRPDGRRDRRHVLDPRPHHPVPGARHPGSAPSAVLMAAMIIHGIQPGPMLMVQNPRFVYEVVAMTTLATVTILLFGLFGVRPLLHVLRVRRHILMPIVFVLCTVGAFATASRLFDIYAMLAIGVLAFFLRRRGYEMAPLVLGLVLGPLLDKSLRRGLVLSDGSVVPFFTRPICIAFASVTIFMILMYVPAFRAGVGRLRSAVVAALSAPFRR